MKLEDLRLGNWVKIDVGVGKVCCLMTIEFENYALGEDTPICVNVEGYNTPRGCTAEEVEGVKLTEEILLGCGFKKRENDELIHYSYSTNNSNWHVYPHNGTVIADNEYTFYGIVYLHELQNLIYSADKEELEVKL